VTLLEQARLVLRDLGRRPHKRLGQHFLVDEAVVDRMVAVAKVDRQDSVMEIGPGLGALSDVLVQHARSLVLVEKDKELAARLSDRFLAITGVSIVANDFLRTDLSHIIEDPPVKVVASLPYNVATAIIFRLLDSKGTISEATLMLQREVAQRISASPGTKAYGALSVFVQLHATVETICEVGPRSFYPAPKVRSQVIQMVVQDTPKIEILNTALFRRIVKAAFGRRRKTLKNALKVFGEQDFGIIAKNSGLDLQRRGETLSVEEFAHLANTWPTRNLQDGL